MVNIDDLIINLNECNTTYEFEKIYKLIKKLIDNDISIKEIDMKCPNLTGYDIIDYLIRYENDINNLKAIENYYNNIKINQNKCLVIADNHMGRLAFDEKYSSSQFYKNEYGLYVAYNHALKYNINNILHLGDLLEGDSDSKTYKLPTIQCQLEYLEKAYPHLENIKTYLLYGNHDYNLIYFNNIYKKFYKLCPNMELIGVNYSYVNFCNYIIKLSHESKMSKEIKNIEMLYNFELSGHSHIFNMNENERLINIPSLSSISLDKENIGFIEMINEGDEFLFKFFNQNDKEVKEKRLNK